MEFLGRQLQRSGGNLLVSLGLVFAALAILGWLVDGLEGGSWHHSVWLVLIALSGLLAVIGLGTRYLASDQRDDPASADHSKASRTDATSSTDRQG